MTKKAIREDTIQIVYQHDCGIIEIKLKLCIHGKKPFPTHLCDIDYCKICNGEDKKEK